MAHRLFAALAPLLGLGMAFAQAPPMVPPVAMLVDDDAEALVRQLNNDGAIARGKDGSKIGRELRDVFCGASCVRATPFQRFATRVQGWSFSIAQNPQPGQYRYLRFAWKRTDGAAVMIQLHASNRWDQRYYAGQLTANVQGWGPMKAIGEAVPRDWELVTRDLFQDFGAITITGIAFTPMEGPGVGLFDYICLGRTIKDLDLATDAAFGKLPLKEALSPPELENLWSNLASADARLAGRAIRTLVAGRKESVAYVKERLNRKPEPFDTERAARLVTELDDENFDVREDAFDSLDRLGPVTIKVLQQARTASKSTEQRKRIDALLRNHSADESGLSAEQLRTLRTIRVLEWCGTAEAQEILKELSQHPLEAGLNEDVRKALTRLERQRK
jgi:hypothetical protein